MNYKDIAFWVMIIIVIALCIYVLFYIKTESYKCIANPYSYSVKLMEKANNADVSCTCNTLTYPVRTAMLDRNGVHAIMTTDVRTQPFSFSVNKSL